MKFSEYKVVIWYAARANLHHLQQFLKGLQRDSRATWHNPSTWCCHVGVSFSQVWYQWHFFTIYLLNILFCWTRWDHVVTHLLMCCSYVSIFRSFFLQAFRYWGHRWWDGSECWRGYYQSLRPTQLGLSLNIGTDLFQKKISLLKTTPVDIERLSWATPYIVSTWELCV